MTISLMLAIMTAVPAALPPQGEIPVEVSGPEGALKGTMLPGSADGPVMLILPGSGPTDRDGNNPLGVRAATYKLLAEGLARRGVTTVRIDKRGMFESASAIADANAVTVPDYVADVRSWTAEIRQRTGADCVWLLGHSEGGLIALAAAHDVADVCGLVLVATAGRPLGTVLRDQLSANPANAPLLDQAFGAIDALEAGRKADTSDLHPALSQLFAPQIQNFLISLFSYDPAKLAAAYDGPILVLQGGRDIQVSEEDARRLSESNEKAELVIIPDANHVLKPVASDDRAANLAAYADPALPLVSGVVDAIADFVK